LREIGVEPDITNDDFVWVNVHDEI
jgi:hypothetical protein